MKKFSTIIMLVLFLAVQSISALTGRQIMEKTDALPQGKSSKSKVEMHIYRNGVLKEKKEFKLTRKKINGNFRTLVEFIKPTKLKFLTHSFKGKDDNQWLKTRSGRPKQISSSDKGKPFVHSHIFYEDMQTIVIDNFTYKLNGNAKALGQNCYKVTCLKKQNKVYDKTVVYIRKSDYFIIRSDFYKKGKLLKYFEISDVRKINGILTPFKSTMTLANGKGKTILMVKSVKHNINVTNSTFNKSKL